MSKTLWAGVLAAHIVASASYAETADEIVAKHVKAQGGLDRLKAIQTMRIRAKSEAAGREDPITILHKRPQMIRVETKRQGLTQIQACDGRDGWAISPFQGRRDAEPMSPDEMKRLENQADIDGPLVDYQAKGNKVELIGKDKLEGTDVYKLRVTLKNGALETLYIDADSFMLIKSESKRIIRGVERETETELGDYKLVQGVMMPFSIERGAKGAPFRQKMAIEKIEVNVPIDDAVFQMPPKRPPVPAAGPKP